MKFSVYADGSSGGNSIGAIGWGWVVLIDDTQVLCAGCGGAPTGTNNVAELMGAREGLKALLAHQSYQDRAASGLNYRVELVSDSQYVLGLANGSYAASKNVMLAEHVRDVCLKNFVATRWVRGHAGEPVNEMCDRLAKLGKEAYIPNKVKRRRDKKRRKRSK